MKTFIIPFITLSLLFTSCGEDKTETENPVVEQEQLTYKVNDKTAIIKWTAYKTTEKKPVGGSFKEVKLKEVPKADSPQKAIEGLEFSIPVSSLDTENESRDTKIKSLFFGVMNNTELIGGTFKSIEGDDKEGHGVIAMNMNDVSCDIPFDYTVTDNLISIVTELNIRSFEAEEALKSLNDACYDLHKGADGISKTWEDVAIEASIEFTKE